MIVISVGKNKQLNINESDFKAKKKRGVYILLIYTRIQKTTEVCSWGVIEELGL